jgi:hypothetical protein
MDRIKLFLYKIRFVLSHIPVLWNSPNHDYYSIMIVTVFKLKQLLKIKEELVEALEDIDGYYDDDIPKIKVAITLFERAYNDYYFDRVFELMKLEYGKDVLKINFVKVEDGDNNRKYFTIKNEYDSWENAKEVGERYRYLTDKYNKKQEKVEKLCWNYFAYYGKNWW